MHQNGAISCLATSVSEENHVGRFLYLLLGIRRSKISFTARLGVDTTRSPLLECCTRRIDRRIRALIWLNNDVPIGLLWLVA